jgi:hypothetical protein
MLAGLVHLLRQGAVVLIQGVEPLHQVHRRFLGIAADGADVTPQDSVEQAELGHVASQQRADVGGLRWWCNGLGAANALGFGCNWVTRWFSYSPGVKAHLGLAANERIAGVIHIGTAIERQADRKRPVLGDVVRKY